MDFEDSPPVRHLLVTRMTTVKPVSSTYCAETHMWGRQLAAMLALYTDKGVAPEVNLRERTLGPAYNEFGYNKHPDTKRKQFSVELTPSHWLQC